MLGWLGDPAAGRMSEHLIRFSVTAVPDFDLELHLALPSSDEAPVAPRSGSLIEYSLLGPPEALHCLKEAGIAAPRGIMSPISYTSQKNMGTPKMERMSFENCAIPTWIPSLSYRGLQTAKKQVEDLDSFEDHVVLERRMVGRSAKR